MLKLRTRIRRTMVLLLMFAAFATIAWYTGKNINEYNEDELNRNINIVMEQNVDTMTQSLGKHLSLVEGTAKRISFIHKNPEEINGFIRRQNSMKELYGFLRIGFIYPDGKVVAPGEEGENLFVRDFFQRSMRGETVITPLLLNNVDNTLIPVNVVSAPVYDEIGKIAGVTFETLPSSFMEEIMSRGFFAEFGSNALINNNGEVLAADKNSELVTKYADLLPYMTIDAGNKKVTDWQQRLRGSNSVTMYFERDGGQYLHFAPLLLEDRIEPIYIGVLMSRDFVEKQTKGFKSYIFNQMVLIVLMAALGFGYFIYDVIKQEVKNKKNLERLAYVSPVTKDDNFAKLCANLAKSSREGYVVCLDLVEFAVVKSTFGAERGNELLKGVWEQIKGHLRPGDLAGHVNNDRFGIFFAETDVDVIEAKLRSLNKSLAIFSEQVMAPKLTAVYGLAAFKPGDDGESAYTNANLAEQVALESKDKLYAVYGDVFTKEFAEKNELENEFEGNLINKRFEIWYQPKYNSFDKCIIGAEALVRLRDSQNNLIMPGKFIPVFEKDGLIRDLDEYVFRSVCEKQKERLVLGKKVVPVSVNLSRVSLFFPNVVNRYAEIAAEIGVPVELVPIEITETAYVNITNIRELLKEFIAKGFNLHMDDFGCGYSSLAALNELPFDAVKIDKSLIDYIGSENGDNMLKHIIQLSQERGMKIIAEGVEKKEQVEFLKKYKVNCIQGMYYSQAVEYEVFEKKFD